MTKQYGHQGQKFIHTQFVILCNRVANLILAYCLCKNKDHVMAPQTASYKIVMASWSNSLSSWFQYESLMFVCFPIVVLGKSFKIVPVMILSRCLLTHKYSTLQYCSASIVSSGLWIFLNGVGNRAETGMQDKESIHITFGLVLILFYISFDAFTSNWQKRLLSVSSDRAIGRYQLMFWFNAWSALICFVGLIPTVDQVLQFIITHGLNSRFLFHICTLSTCSAAGQWFVYRTLDCFGPVVFASIMAFRQMLSAFISCIVYKHQLSLKGWLGLLTISIGVGMFISSNRKDTSKTSLKTIDKV
ncbi:hypothetical protein GJ496_012028 [Pomphorhynchus laevis]|nr:hypothetical protein GJ496_012028 [Pomphorhynchus laevis]